MRDDFPVTIKDVLAKRVGFRCSNSDCRQPTSGPQTDPSKAVNVGVAAHITAASPQGPRYDPVLTPEERSSINNGIWLCQICAKLVDNDSSRYRAETLKAWKREAEEAAIKELESRQHRIPKSDKFARLEKQMPQLLIEMRQDIARHPLRREFVLLKRNWTYWAKGNELFYYFDNHPDLLSQIQILENYGLVREITYNNVQRYIMSEELAQYLGD
ncbi:MAG: hypothetical protein Q6358_15615 [Candidatus Brocadiales bacterium]|nr:hypothetical protein [Candidatus Brocadiales bacterium]